MTQQKIPSQWQLQDTGEPADQWMLREDEQRLPRHMQLHEEQGGPSLAETSWQPIDYQAMQAAAQRPRRGGAALTTLLVLALLGVGGYLAWFYMGQPGLASLMQRSEAVTTPEGVAEAPAGQALEPTPMTELPPAEAPVVAPAPVEPTPTLPPPSPTPVLIEVRQATVDSQYGVNLRESANSTSTLVRVLDNGTTHLVLTGPVTDAAGGAWYQLAAAGGTQGWASGDFIRIASQTLPLDQARPLYEAAGVEPPAAPSPAEPAPADAAVPVTTTTTATTTAAVTTTAVPTTAVAAAAPLTVTAAVPAAPEQAAAVQVSGVISAPAGLNLRREAASGDNVIRMLDDQTPLTVIGRSQDGQWVQVQLADSTRGWLSADFVNVTGDIDTVPLGTVLPLTPTVTSEAAAAPAPAATAPVAATEPVTGVTSAGGLGTIQVTSVLGVNVRPQPLASAAPLVQLAWNATAQAVGRTANNEWVKVSLQDGTTGWVAASAVSVSSGLTTLPVVE